MSGVQLAEVDAGREFSAAMSSHGEIWVLASERMPKRGGGGGGADVFRVTFREFLLLAPVVSDCVLSLLVQTEHCQVWGRNDYGQLGMGCSLMTSPNWLAS